MIGAAVDAPVRQHDDGSAPGMYDLDIIRIGEPPAAVEVTTATDGESVALWKLVNGSGETFTLATLTGGWRIDLRPTARGRRVLRELPALLANLEASGQRRLDTEWVSESDDGTHRAIELGIVSAVQNPTSVPGSVYFRVVQPLSRAGGAVPVTGNPISSWLPLFLREPEQADVLAKLARSRADERHAFVIVAGFSPAPFEVVDLLIRDDGPLPTVAPDLPVEVTHCWVTSSWSLGHGLRWSAADGWRAFSKLQDRTM